MRIAIKKYANALRIMLIILLFVGISIFIINRCYVFRFRQTSLNDNMYGVIDGNITKVYDNIVYYDDAIGDGQRSC